MSDLTGVAVALKALMKRVEKLEMFTYKLEYRVMELERDLLNRQDDGK